MIAPGCTVTSRSSAPCSRMNSHAASSAIVFDLVYGVRWGFSGSVQSDSVSSRSGRAAPSPALRTAATDEVTTTRFAPAARLARSTRSVPSRAGTISSSGSFGCAGGNGDATCST